ncbi:hypothetical protein D1P53_000228 [Cryptococcus gattii VGV]|nr:hypothetical protein D1P53_000228 [Cryptococcus gattii VGV]
MTKTLITPFIYHPDPPSSEPNPYPSNPSLPEAKLPRRSIFYIPPASRNQFKRLPTEKDLPPLPSKLSEVIESCDGFDHVCSSGATITSGVWSQVSCMTDRDSIRSVSTIPPSIADDVDVSKDVCGEAPEVEEVSVNDSAPLEKRENIEDDLMGTTKDESEGANVPDWILIAIDFNEGNTPALTLQKSDKEMGSLITAREAVVNDKQGTDAMCVEVFPNPSPVCDEQNLNATKRDAVCSDLPNENGHIAISASLDFSLSNTIRRVRTSLRNSTSSRLVYAWNKKRKMRKLARSNAIRRSIGGFAFYEYVIKPRIIDRYILSDIEGNGSTTTSAPSRLQTVIPTATSPSFNGAVGGYIPAVGVWNKADEDALNSNGNINSQVMDQGASVNGQSYNSVGINGAIITIKPTSSAYYASYPSPATTQDWDGYHSGQ